MSRLQKLKDQLTPGTVYRRADLELWTTSVDRHLQELTADGSLKKLATGLYYAPKVSKFGKVPPNERDLVEGFLKDDSFLLVSPNAYNSLGLGTTQLYNTTWVYNHKRKGSFKLGELKFEFKLKSSFPNELSKEYLVVDFMNNLESLAEDTKFLKANLKKNAARFDTDELNQMARRYGTGKTRLLVRGITPPKK